MSSKQYHTYSSESTFSMNLFQPSPQWNDIGDYTLSTHEFQDSGNYFSSKGEERFSEKQQKPSYDNCCFDDYENMYMEDSSLKFTISCVNDIKSPNNLPLFQLQMKANWPQYNSIEMEKSDEIREEEIMQLERKYQSSNQSKTEAHQCHLKAFLELESNFIPNSTTLNNCANSTNQTSFQPKIYKQQGYQRKKQISCFEKQNPVSPQIRKVQSLEVISSNTSKSKSIQKQKKEIRESTRLREKHQKKSIKHEQSITISNNKITLIKNPSSPTAFNIISTAPSLSDSDSQKSMTVSQMQDKQNDQMSNKIISLQDIGNSLQQGEADQSCSLDQSEDYQECELQLSPEQFEIFGQPNICFPEKIIENKLKSRKNSMYLVKWKNFNNFPVQDSLVHKDLFSSLYPEIEGQFLKREARLS